MHCWFCMAIATNLRRVFKIIGLMAGSAFRLEVLANQCVPGGSVVEVSHPVFTIVAVQAIRSKILHMCLAEALLMVCVALEAGLVIHDRIVIVFMTRFAFHRRGIVIFLMPIQAEGSLAMVEKL